MSALEQSRAERYERARAFLRRIDPSAATFTLQTFDDTKAKRAGLTRIVHVGPSDEAFESLSEQNTRGAGIFFAVNETDGKGREAHNIVRVRAVFVDLDGAPLLPVLQAGLDPHCIVKSSPRRWHCYWLVGDCPLDQFKRVQLALAGRFEGDKHVHDLPRVLRLPGFFHCKGDPFLSRVLDAGFDGPPYTLAEIVGALNLNLDATEGRPLCPTPNVLGTIKGSPATNAALPSNLQPEPMQPAEFSATKIIAGCQQFAWAQANQTDVEEPLWRAMIGTLYRTDTPGSIYPFSERHPEYTREDTEDKAKRWKGGGVTCATLESLRPTGCARCAHKGRIKSPSALGFKGQAPATWQGEVVTQDQSWMAAPLPEDHYTFDSEPTAVGCLNLRIPDQRDR